MSLDQPASARAFWAIYDWTGIRPEFLIPVLDYESGLNPTVSNSQGAPYYGIGQNSEAAIAAAGTDVASYLTWPASKQLTAVVLPYFEAIVQQYGALTSGVRVYQAEFYPASLAYAQGPDDIIVKHGDAAYSANAGFDYGKKGYISPRDLAQAIASRANAPEVKAAISAAYAERPIMGPPKDPIWGETSGLSRAQWISVGVLAALGAVYVTWELGGAPRWARRFWQVVG